MSSKRNNAKIVNSACSDMRSKTNMSVKSMIDSFGLGEEIEMSDGSQCMGGRA
jgi:hypothetical protein